MSDVFTMLRNDHRQVESLLDRLGDSEQGAARNAMIDELTKALRLHMQFEEQKLYPIVVKVDSEMAEEASIEHGLAREALAKLAELAAAPGFGAAVEMLSGGIGHHVEEEEKEMFPQLREACDNAAIESLTETLKRMKADAGLPPFDPNTASKEELLALARDAGIEGRSNMTKEELKQALVGR
jgi:hemerythrin superfamily protein